MKRTWLKDLVEAIGAGPVVRAVVVRAEGSCPRDSGASMLVSNTHTQDTIGGGALEFEVIAKARMMLCAMPGQNWVRELSHFHLGPELNQCCGGAVSVLLERFGAAEADVVRALAAQARLGSVVRPVASGVALAAGNALQDTALFRDGGDAWFAERIVEKAAPVILYGAGHVACALVQVLDGLPFDVTWGDVALERFPEQYPRGVAVVAGDLPSIAATAAADAFHLVMTHSHSLDEEIVAAVLRRSAFGFLGLIGSKTKRARFRQRLLKSGLERNLVDRMECPIGLAGLAGKAPRVIAVSVAADLLLRRQRSLDCG